MGSVVMYIQVYSALAKLAAAAVHGFIKKIHGYIQCTPPTGLYTNVLSSEFNDSLLHNMAKE